MSISIGRKTIVPPGYLDTQYWQAEFDKRGVNIEKFPRINGEADDSARIQRAIDSLPNGGLVIAPPGTYTCGSTITVKQNITLMGMGYGRFADGTKFKYTGTGTLFNFPSTTAGAKLCNFKIVALAGESNYQNFTGIDVTRAEWVTIENVLVEGAKIGYDLSGSVGAIYLLRMINVFAVNCLNHGILVRSTGTWKNGIHIKVGDISSNGIGIECQTGEGCVIEGGASEMGSNTTAAIKLTGGNWTLKGALWIENTNAADGVQVTGGSHMLDGDIYCIRPINITGGSLITNVPQAHCAPEYKAITTRGLVCWFPLDEPMGGLNVYDISPNRLIGSYANAPIWTPGDGFFGGTLTPAVTTDGITLPNNRIDFTQSWTIILLGRGANAWEAIRVKGSDGTSIFGFKYYLGGLQQVSQAGFVKNFTTYPGVDLTQKCQWAIISYDAALNKLTSYTNSGKPATVSDFIMPAVFALPSEVKAGIGTTFMDEVIVYNRILTAAEMMAITNLRRHPNFTRKYGLTAAPVNGTWKQGDYVENLTPTEQGTTPNKYVIKGWVCVASGTPGTWVQDRALTGN